MLDNLSSQSGQALTLLAVLSAIPILYGLFRAGKNRNELPYPPGPKGRFLLGTLLDLPPFKPWLSYMKMGKQYNSECGAFVRQDNQQDFSRRYHTSDSFWATYRGSQLGRFRCCPARKARQQVFRPPGISNARAVSSLRPIGYYKLIYDIHKQDGMGMVAASDAIW